ncbi:SSR3 [Cordylochernes scorpioides]|uniref:SSR3 n=1 Tax=Cordylochernes scorpioides TaxID=51811 RepID=A0ABY6KKM4_9ARAC|nr:SSR3 [Cordylochernes scorpioides]
MVTNRKLTKEEELLLQDFSRNVSTKSSALFYGNALIVLLIKPPLQEYNGNLIFIADEMLEMAIDMRCLDSSHSIVA